MHWDAKRPNSVTATNKRRHALGWPLQFYVAYFVMFVLLLLLLLLLLTLPPNLHCSAKQRFCTKATYQELGGFNTAAFGGKHQGHRSHVVLLRVRSVEGPRCPPRLGNGKTRWYCWWKKSCTTKDDDYPIIYRVLTIPGGAGFIPSTVVNKVRRFLDLACLDGTNFHGTYSPQNDWFQKHDEWKNGTHLVP